MRWPYLLLLLPLIGESRSDAQERPPIRDFPVETIAALGREIYRQDQAGWRATDILFSRRLELSEYPLRGWITTEDADGLLVTFVGEVDGELVGVFDIRPHEQSAENFRFVGRRPLTQEERARFVARRTATSAIGEVCSDRYNTVVLKDPERDGWLVYLLAATTERDVIPVGGHYRITVSPDGETLIQSDRLFMSCLRLSSKPPDAPPDAIPTALYMTHVISDSPVETHVFLSLLFRLDFAVGTLPDGDPWYITNGQIGRLGAQ